MKKVLAPGLGPPLSKVNIFKERMVLSTIMIKFDLSEHPKSVAIIIFVYSWRAITAGMLIIILL